MRTIKPVILNLMLAVSLQALDLEREISLRGRWLFEVGDREEYAEAGFDDSGWETIRVPRPWEQYGFPGYDGYAWYRIRFDLPAELREKALYLQLGFIDDVDWVYVNGNYIGGRGSGPPDYQTAFDANRLYSLPGSTLLYGDENVIAVRVYDDWGDGGIVGGDPGIFSQKSVDLIHDLSGVWRFRTGDDGSWREPDYDDRDWDEILVPGVWEAQGYQDYDGYAWYRTEFRLRDVPEDERLILVLGPIDDIDEVFLNGVRIGRTGRFPGERYLDRNNNYWNRPRFYTIKRGALRDRGVNTLAVRVYDTWRDGGIYEGPVGVTTKDEYLEYQKKNRKKLRHVLEELLKDWF